MTGPGGDGWVSLRRACSATTVPLGQPVELGEGGQIQVVQQRGGSLTLRTEMGTLLRIDATDADAVGLEAHDLRRVVCDEPDGWHAFQAQDCRRRVIGARVGRQPQREVCLDGVQPLVLEAIGADLVHEPDAATFLTEIEQRPASLGGDQAQRLLQLLAAITAERS